MYGNEAVPCTDGKINIHQPTLTERIKRERDEVAARLTHLDAALQALETNPQVKAVLDMVQKVSRY